MILISSASADTYITNKIIESTRAVSGNVGRAGTLDLFKLYDESSYITGSSEISRLLIKFDIQKAVELSTSSLNISSETFKAKLRLKNIAAGQSVPTNFNVEIFPLAVSFEEGFGRDVISFADVDSSNYLSSSKGVLWNAEGASQQGVLGDSNIDYYASGNLLDGEGVRHLGFKQNFPIGTEDLEIDITTLMSATIANILPNNGFRISFLETEENDSTTRFVKRFGSRHVRQQSLRPTLLFSCDDNIKDDHENAYFDSTNSLIVHNFVKGDYSNFVSGSSFTEITGSDCALVRLTTGSFTQYFTASQLSNSSNITGIYSASVSFYSSDSSTVFGETTIKDHLTKSGSITFEEIWTSLDETVTFLSSSLKMNSIKPTTKSSGVRKIRSSLVSTPSNLRAGTSTKIRICFYDDYEQNTSSKFFLDPVPLKVSSCKMRIRDDSTGNLIYDFNESGTELSCDSSSYYTTLYTDSLPKEVSLSLEFRISLDGETIDISNKNFKVVVKE